MSPAPGDGSAATPRVAADPDLVAPPPTPVSRDSTAGVVVMAHLRRQTAALLAADAGIDTDAPDAVHAARVAARRLRSGLRVYGDLLRDDVSVRLRPELAWYAGNLSPARDLEVFAASLEGGADDDEHGAGEALLPWLRRRHEQALAVAVREVRSPRAAALRLALVELARAPAFLPEAGRTASRVLAARVLRADLRGERAIDPLRPGDPPDAWHAARIAAKRARYAAEVGAPALGRACADLARVWTSLTEPLGDAQDAAIQRALVLERVDDSATPLSAGEAFACGLFVAATHDRELACHRRARDAWADSRAQHHGLRRRIGG